MNWAALSYDWTQVRAFLATAEEGSLSAAARVLGTSQPTIGRQVAALEEALGVTLFERTSRALALTPAGQEILVHARAMAQAGLKLSLTATGQSQMIEGRVSITATDFVVTYYLPKVLVKLREMAPRIEIDLIASNDVQDLTQREADIALRHARPEQPELIARKLSQTTAEFWATQDYLDRIGNPTKPEDMGGASFIGFDDRNRYLAFFQQQGFPVTAENFPYATASGAAMLELTCAGLGIGLLTRDMATLAPELVPALPDHPVIDIPVWLVSHRELMTSRKIRLVYDLLASELSQGDLWRGRRRVRN